ncbi:MAG: Flp pilus assembly complex ATPase component TadA [Phycisphaerales bacterium]|nr:Flp pilus assembly complex ATPase component TadA [Phycisphaerales bacterium]
MSTTFILANATSTSLMGALPAEGGYFSIVKIALFIVAVLIWAHNSAWVEKDIKTLRVPKGLWVLAVFGTGALCLLLWLLVPLYWVGFGLFAALYGTAILCYVYAFRNRRVAPAQTVLTISHLQRLGQGGGQKKDMTHAHDRVRLTDANGKSPPWPKDPEEHAAYQEMQELLFDAIWRRASDVRMDMLPNQPIKIIYKVDGVDRAREPLDPESGARIFGHLKRIGGMNPDEHRRPQTGHLKAAIGAGGAGDKTVEIDIKTSGSTAGQRILLKMFADEAKFRLLDLGFTKSQLKDMESIVAEPKGVVIISGPKASGITSSLYAILRAHDAFMQNIHTLEVTKALELENITQHVYDSQDGTISFGKRFRSLLRTEPDVAMAGDTPDTETAALAAAQGRQNKKIYLGMTANDTFSALRRYLQGVNDNALAASSLLAITSQRLARVVCNECRRAYKPDPAVLKKANLPTGENRPFYRPPNPSEMEVDKQGNPIMCPICQGTGYIGRTAIFELLILNDALREQISKNTPLPTLKVEARKQGMLYLQEIALHKVYEGQTSINEVLRVTKDTASAKQKTPVAS